MRRTNGRRTVSFGRSQELSGHDFQIVSTLFHDLHLTYPTSDGKARHGMHVWLDANFMLTQLQAFQKRVDAFCEAQLVEYQEVQSADEHYRNFPP